MTVLTSLMIILVSFCIMHDSHPWEVKSVVWEDVYNERI